MNTTVAVFFSVIEMDRIILTRSSKRITRHDARTRLFIRDNKPLKQIKQVFEDLHIDPGDLKPFSRCLICNLETEFVDKQSLAAKIPPHIWHRHQHFRTCAGCHRIYWPGSHHRRLVKRFETLFLDKGHAINE